MGEGVDVKGGGGGLAQVRALETTDGHDQTEYNRILKGMYQPGVPGKHFR